MKNSFLILILVLSYYNCKNNSVTNQQPEISNPYAEFNIDLNLKYQKPNGALADFEQIFTAQEISALEDKLTDKKTNSNKEVIIVTVNDIEPYQEIIVFGHDLLKAWNSEISKKEDGLLIIISI